MWTCTRVSNRTEITTNRSRAAKARQDDDELLGLTDDIELVTAK